MLSFLTLSVICICFIFWCIGVPVGTIPLRGIRAINFLLMNRKGFIWTMLVYWSGGVVIISVCALLWIDSRLITLQVISLTCIPPIFGWWLRHWVRKRIARRFELPRRKRIN